MEHWDFKSGLSEYRLSIERASRMYLETQELQRAHFAEVSPEKVAAGFTFDPTYEYYMAQERAGRLFMMVLWHGKEIPVGYLVFTLFPSKMTGLMVGADEAWYIDPAHRKGWVAVKMLRYMEAALRKLGATEMLLGFTGKDISSLYRLVGMRPVSTVYGKVLTNVDAMPESAACA